MAKPGTFSLYPHEAVDLAERGLLTVWGSLTRFHESLVLVGGLAVRLSTLSPEADQPGPVTLDVDLGIHMGVDSRMYYSLKETLQAQGFDWDGKRFVRRQGNLELYVDLLTDGEGDASTVMVDDGLAVTVMPGVSRALETAREQNLSGKNLLGAECSEYIRVSGPGPLMVLKLNAFGGPTGRRAPKDSHDILYLGERYPGGTRALVEAFLMEREMNNRATTRGPFGVTKVFRS